MERIIPRLDNMYSYLRHTTLGLAAVVINSLLGEDYGALAPIDKRRQTWLRVGAPAAFSMVFSEKLPVPAKVTVVWQITYSDIV